MFERIQRPERIRSEGEQVKQQRRIAERQRQAGRSDARVANVRRYKVLVLDLGAGLFATRWIEPSAQGLYNRIECKGPDADGPHSRIKWDMPCK